MESWQQKFLDTISKLEEEIDQQRFHLKEKMGRLSPATIQAYRGYGSGSKSWMLGRVLENEGLELPPKDASIWQNIASLYYRYESDEIPRARVEYSLPDKKEIVTCNQEGFFEIHPSIKRLLEEGSGKWRQIPLRLVEPYQENQEEVQLISEIQVQQESNRFGLISDIDDTIIVTKATDFLEKMRIFLLRNSHTRKPFEGVAAFYRALERGKGKKDDNPIFYVSSSSWNLYDVFDQFCQINHIPKGTFLLRELGVSKNQFIRSGHKGHKMDKISQVLETFSSLPFVLIGDSGQKDPEIYLEVVNRFPGRIKVIYIRDVHPEISDSRDQEVKEIAEKAKEKGVEMVLVQNSMEAAKHAVELGLIHADSLEEIEKETHEDKNRPSDISQLLGLDKIL